MPKFIVADGLVDYHLAIQGMQATIQDIQNGSPEVVWFLEHPSVYTAGTSAKSGDLLEEVFPVIQTGRGGQYTYHGPGQLTAYVMVDLKKRHLDVRAFVKGLENWIILTLKHYGLNGKLKPGRIGVWLDGNGIERKIAAIGVRVSRGITWHGLALNVCPDLSHYRGIVPCGLANYGVTSLKAEGVDATMAQVIKVMQDTADDCGIW